MRRRKVSREGETRDEGATITELSNREREEHRRNQNMWPNNRSRRSKRETHRGWREEN